MNAEEIKTEREHVANEHEKLLLEKSWLLRSPDSFFRRQELLTIDSWLGVIDKQELRLAEVAKAAKMQARFNRLNAASCRVETQLVSLMSDAYFEEYFQGLAAERLRLEEERKQLEAEREALRVAQQFEQLEIDEERAVERLRIEEDRQQLAYDQAIADELAADRLADEQVTADEFRAAKNEGRIVAGHTGKFAKSMAKRKLQIQINDLADQVGFFEIPKSLQLYSDQIRDILKAAGDKIQEIA